MNTCRRNLWITLLSCISPTPAFPQSENYDNLPKDYLTPAFHAGRRQALRDLMPANSVTVIFSYPEAIFSRDVDYVYHANPDLYYFSGYTEANSVLLIFKEMQSSWATAVIMNYFSSSIAIPLPNGSRTGRRLGVEGVKSTLGFKMVYNGEEFGTHSPDLRKFNHYI